MPTTQNRLLKTLVSCTLTLPPPSSWSTASVVNLCRTLP